jgi:hypothetical protein
MVTIDENRVSDVDFLGFLRKRKAVEENWKTIEEIRKPLKKAESR